MGPGGGGTAGRRGAAARGREKLLESLETLSLGTLERGNAKVRASRKAGKTSLGNLYTWRLLPQWSSPRLQTMSCDVFWRMKIMLLLACRF
jgi:hypothetical protein